MRPARPEELEPLNDLITESARVLSAGFYSARQIEALIRHVFGVDTQLILDRTYYVIERGGGLVACGGWSHRRTLFGGDQAKADSDADLDPGSEAARIRAFFVHPAAARQGLGRRLLSHCESEAYGAGFGRLELMATLPGEPFYRAAGYEALERVRHPLPDVPPVELVRMGRSLAERSGATRGGA
ncbi:MAG TPA: GNAT family N-acetyltransferase [Gemmatimonadales bacterium]|nr:GNAT family N-acetyltransferase [Gemmatimonadales bacterium]